MLRPDPIGVDMFKRILVVKTRSIGDNIIMLPALRLLRESFPDADIEVLTVTESAAPLFHIPFINGVYSFQKKGSVIKRLWQTLLVLRRIRKKHFDLLINLQASEGSEKLSILAGAKKRLICPYIYGRRSRYNHFGIVKPKVKTQSAVEDIEALRPLGVYARRLSFDYPVSEEMLLKAKDFLSKHSIAPKRFIVIHPGSSEKEKRWSYRNYAALVDHIKKLYGLQSVFVFTKNESQIYESILDESTARPIGFSVVFDLLAAIIKQSLLFIGSDSAPRHLACALNIPTITLMAKDRRDTWHPYNKKYHKVIVGELEQGNKRFIDRITPDELFSVLKELMAII